MNLTVVLASRVFSSVSLMALHSNLKKHVCIPCVVSPFHCPHLHIFIFILQQIIVQLLGKNLLFGPTWPCNQTRSSVFSLAAKRVRRWERGFEITSLYVVRGIRTAIMNEILRVESLTQTDWGEMHHCSEFHNKSWPLILVQTHNCITYAMRTCSVVSITNDKKTNELFSWHKWAT